MKKKLNLMFYVLAISVILFLVGFHYIDHIINGNHKRINETEEILKEKMEAKYDIVIKDSKGFYTSTIGYGATFTTVSGITFEAWNRPQSIIDFYREELWKTKALQKWGYADEFITGVKEFNVNIGYRLEERKDNENLSKTIVEAKSDLWISIYVDLEESYNKKKALEIETGIFNYYQQLLKDDGKDIELIVRYDENSHNQDTGSYMNSRDLSGKFPIIKNVRNVSKTLHK
ncbi:hypothetical protein [Metabacillus litoralis]|uniref:hypothetical protein n=1 Tax=Metabacillus litoralis TaxID=152268 RepID=UPI001CFCE6F6|nr:hypothetical protein [Metabacillus litoralis]